MMSDSKLSAEMLDMFRANMKALDPQAEPTEYQEMLTKAISTGLIEVLKVTGTVGAAPAPVSIGVNGMGLLVDPGVMQKAAKAKMISQTGAEGSALDLILQSVMIPIAKHLAEAVEVVSTSGFGGQGLPPVVEDSVLSASIIKELPTDIASNLAKSKHGLDLINSVAFGLATGLKIAVPGFVLVGSVPPPPGLLVASFK